MEDIEMRISDERKGYACFGHQALVLVDLAFGGCQTAATLEQLAATDEASRFRSPHQLQLERGGHDRSLDRLGGADFCQSCQYSEVNGAWSDEMFVAGLQDDRASICSEYQAEVTVEVSGHWMFPVVGSFLGRPAGIMAAS